MTLDVTALLVPVFWAMVGLVGAAAALILAVRLCARAGGRRRPA